MLNKFIKYSIITSLLMFSKIANADYNTKLGARLLYFVPFVTAEINNKTIDTSGYLRAEASFFPLFSFTNSILNLNTEYVKTMSKDKDTEINIFLGTSFATISFLEEKSFAVAPFIRYGIEFGSESAKIETAILNEIKPKKKSRKSIMFPMVSFKYSV